MTDEEKIAIINRMLAEGATNAAMMRATEYESASGLKLFCERKGIVLPKRKPFVKAAGYDDPEINRRRQEGIKAYYARKKAAKIAKQYQPPKKEEIEAHFTPKEALATPEDVKVLAHKFKVKGLQEKENDEMVSNPTPAVFQRFEKAGPDPEGGNRNGARIRCGKCDRTSTFRKHGTLSPDHVAQMFRNRGWAVGGGPRADRCPACKNKMGHHEVAEQPKPVVAPPAPQPQIVKDIPFFDEKPKEAPAIMQRTIEDKPVDAMTRTDKRVIFAKLEEVYGDETTGYKGDWNDEKVATDLGIPTAWVSLVRDDSFGPAKNAAETAKKLAEIMALAELCRAQHTTLQTEVVALAEAVKVYQDNMAKLEEKLAAVK